MSRRDHERADDELADWLAQLGEPAPDEDAAPGPAPGAAGPPAPPTVPPDPSTVPSDPPTVPSDPPTVPSQPPRGGHAPSGAWPPHPEPSARPPRDDDQSRSSRRLWLLAALPWLVMAAAALAAWADVGATDEPGPGGGATPDSATADDSGIASPDSTEPRDRDGESAEMNPAADPGVSGPAGAGGPPPGELAAAAEAAVRTVGARQLAGVDDAAVHVGYARATATSPLGDGVVVTVAALVRHATDGAWSEPDPIRFAVVLDGDGRLREPPWPLPGVELTTDGPEPAELDPVDLAAADDLVDAASRALTRAGYETPDVQALHRVGEDRALRVEALARPPGARERGAVVAWLTPDGGRVLGRRPAASEGAATDRGAPEEADS